MFPRTPRRRWLRVLAAAALLAAGSLGFASTAAATSEEGPSPAVLPTIPLHNDTAQTGTDCPGDGAAYWHFVLTPNDGSSAFVAITLNLTSETVTFTGAQIVPNGGQLDNVFVAVPAGHALTDLRTSGSYATYDGGSPTHFNLSHVCEGTVPDTEPPVTEPPVTEPPATEPPATDATVLGATEVKPEVLGSTQAAAEPVTQLPYTGAETAWLAASGLALVAGGLLLAQTAKARRAEQR